MNTKFISARIRVIVKKCIEEGTPRPSLFQAIYGRAAFDSVLGSVNTADFLNCLDEVLAEVDTK